MTATLRKYSTRMGMIALLGTVGPIVLTAQGPPEVRPGPSTPVTVVNTPADPVPVTGSIGVNGPVAVTQSGVWTVQTEDPFAPGATATRLGPVSIGVFPSSGVKTIVPTVPAGSVFIVKYLNALATSNISGVYATDTLCQLEIAGGSSSTTAGALPLTKTSFFGSFVASEQLFLPIGPGEALNVRCFVTPAISYDVRIVGGGHYVPAGT